MKASLPKVRKGLLDKTHVSYGANAMFGDLMSMAKSLACFLDTATTSELAGNIKYNQEERDGDGHAFLPLHDYLKLAEGAHAGEIAKLTKA
ncbi:MAG: hypothetical protein MK515_07870 [SAR324 cluster bacterium]|jgi:hypothetical protein|nr:hypothetical protein [SAR324 cluster bacterium]